MSARLFTTFSVMVLGFATCSISASWADSVPTLTDNSIDRNRLYIEEATQKTQDLLRDKKKRADSIKSGEGQKADRYVNEMTGGNETTNQAVYDLSADVFAILVKKVNGDPEKMKAILEKFSTNPEDFANDWSPEEKAKLHDLSLKMPQRIPAQQ